MPVTGGGLAPDNNEIRALRLSTDSLIRARPTRIRLKRPAALVSDGRGGFTRATLPVEQSPRERYFAPIKDETKTPLSSSENVSQGFHINHILIGPYDDDIRSGDKFVIGGEEYIVARVNPDKRYQVKAEVGFVTGASIN